MKPKNINNSLIDVSYFINNKSLPNENEGYLAKHYRIIELAKFNNSILPKNLNIINQGESNEKKITQNNVVSHTNTNIIKNNKGINTPFSKISFSSDPNLSNIYKYDIFKNFSIKRNIIANSITNTPSRNNKKMFEKANSLNSNKNNNHNVNNININFPFLNYNSNIRTNNIKERKKYRGTIRINTNSNLNKCMTINLEKKNEDDKIDKTINKKS